MDAFSLLKFWRSGGGGFAGSRALTGRAGGGSSSSSSSGTTTILAVTSPHSSDSGSNVPPESDGGRFIDLEFTTAPEDKGDDGEKVDQIRRSERAVVDDGDDDGSGSEDSYGENEEGGGEGALNLTFSAASSSSGSSVDRADPYSSDDIFFNAAGVLPMESSASDARGAENSRFPASLVKKAAKFRVLMLKLNRARANTAEKTDSEGANNPSQKAEEDESRIGMEKTPLTVRFTVVEGIEPKSSAEERKFSRETMEKYLNFVRPLYVRVSKRYGGEKLGFSGQVAEPKAEKGETDPAKMADKPAFRVKQGLRGLREQLIRSRSAAPSPSGQWSSRRRDDSLLQQQDGIQSAILHCKRSFHSTRDDSNLCSLSRTRSQESPVNLSDGIRSVEEPHPQTG